MYRWIGVLLIAFVAACNKPAPVPLAVTELPTPAARDSLAPNLSVSPDGHVLLSWLEPGADGEFALRFSLHGNEGWSAPQTITTGKDWFVSGADYPSVAFMADGTMVANSLIATNLIAEAYNTNIFMSHDNGATWSAPVSLHRDTKERQHGFVSFVPAPDGHLGAIWLDGRNLSEEAVGDMALLFASIGKDGSITDETTLDPRVCECCQTSAAATADGMIAVYRDRSPDEVRDIWVTRFADGKWSTPAPVAEDGWKIEGCPVNGPAVASNGKNVAVAWLTLVDEKPQVRLALSTDAGQSFGKPIKIDDGNPKGHVDVASLESGEAIVSWVERADQKSELRIRRVESNGSVGPALAVSGAAGVQPDAFPRIKRSGDDLFLTWTASGEQPRVQTASVKLQ
ncbi:MAG TPA: sialidase family protein [Terriglobia bacterium]|nr:sialidase family protein [Terriglobia bacterium]